MLGWVSNSHTVAEEIYIYITMDEVTPRIFNRKVSLEEIKQGTGDPSSVEQLARHFKKNLRTAAATNEELYGEINNGDNLNNVYGGSSRKGLMSASTSAFTKPDAEVHGSHEHEYEYYQAPRPTGFSTTSATAKDVTMRLQKEASGKIPYHRRASPIARMRDTGFQMESSTNANRAGIDNVTQDLFHSNCSPGPQKQGTKSDHEVKKDKRRSWKKKMKIAQAKKRRERRALDDYTVGSSSQFGRNSAIIGCVLDNVEGTNLFQRIAQCTVGEYHRGDGGTASSECEESEYGSASSTSGSNSEDSYSDEDETFFGVRLWGRRSGNRDTKRRGRSQKRRGRSPSRESSADRTNSSEIDPSVDTTVPEEMTASFLSTGDDRTEISTNDRNSPERGISPGKAASATTAGFSNATDHAHYGIPMSSTGFFQQPATATHAFQGSSPGFIKTFIEDIENKGESLLWHEEAPAMDPRNVIIRLKRGYRTLNGAYCAPRLIWTDRRQGLNYGFDIFDIQSLERAEILQLNKFPYAMPGRSMLLQLKNSTSFIFETGTEEDALRFVRGVRWIVTRLAYNLVIGNLDVSCELLDLGLIKPRSTARDICKPESPGTWSRAMDDVTEKLIDNAIASRFEV